MSNAMTITKIKNIYIMLLHAISKENIAIVDHYLDDKLAAYYNNIIENNKKNNIKQVFRQPNITNIITIEQNEEQITIQCLIRYISYFVNRQTNKYVSGDNKNRISKTAILKFRKNNTESKTIIHCPNCGASLKVNTTSICSYCGNTLDERFSPYVLFDISYQ